MFTEKELKKAKELAYANWNKALNDEDSVGFEYKGQWISNPFIEQSGRFEFVNYEAMCNHYGTANVEKFIKEILSNKEYHEIKTYMLFEKIVYVPVDEVADQYEAMEIVSNAVESCDINLLNEDADCGETCNGKITINDSLVQSYGELIIHKEND